jgi:subtilisin family serine protease
MLGLALLLIWIASACTPKPPTPTVTPPPTLTPVPTVSKVEDCSGYVKAGLTEQNNHPEYKDLMYIEGQVVVTGDSDQIKRITEEMNPTLKEPLELSEEFHLSNGRAIQLYKIAGGESVELVTCKINAQGQELGVDVSADPNYHLSPAQWAGGESPWTQNGQWAQGLPGGGLGQVQEGVPGESFLTQWAFSPDDGIDLFEDEERTVTYMGEGVRIGIFDSSPFPDEFEAEGKPLEVTLSITETITGTEFQVDFPSLMGGLDFGKGEHRTLTVWHLWHTEVITAPNCPGEPLEGQDHSNHGLFVAGLAHAVAPASEIYLVRVLENDGCGNLYSIGDGIRAFVEEMQERNPDGPIVVSLSLGAHKPPNSTSMALPPEVESLQDVIAYVMGKGAVVVAAAGNDSYNVKLPPSEMEIPAKDPGVVGVAASNVDRERGCFSNIGKVAAPGGNGMAPCEIPVQSDLMGSPEYVCEQDPSYCLVGPIYKPHGPGYAYWVGTSFATPLVSGFTALSIEKKIREGNWPLENYDASSTSPTDDPKINALFEGSTCGSATSLHHLGIGIINLPHALNGAPCPAP